MLRPQECIWWVSGNIRFWTGFTHSFAALIRQHFSDPSQSLSLLQKSQEECIWWVSGNIRFWTGFTHSFAALIRQHFSDPSQSLSLLQKSAFPAIVGSAGRLPGLFTS
ncbi:hypothetical protein M513_00050 [Trichuris suis]|uniref:Uncharacterized protein n=1 Tax=Trichuris suis TaxID=68888 RepID=A0A085MNU1_9BILA|nr:hypothetical protein M513_00050 [Trichuris suis]